MSFVRPDAERQETETDWSTLEIIALLSVSLSGLIYVYFFI